MVDLYSDSGRDWLAAQYGGERRSIADLAAELNASAYSVRQALIMHGIERRGRSEAQRQAVESGRHQRELRHSRETRERISESVAEHWRGLSPEERGERSRLAAEQWQRMGEEDRRVVRERANEGVRRAAAEGSRAEHFLLNGLREAGHRPEWRPQGLPADIVLREQRVAVSVHGPAHYLPIWGEAGLQRRMRADDIATAALLGAGFSVVRVKCLLDGVSDHQLRKVLRSLLGVLQSRRDQVIELEVAP